MAQIHCERCGEANPADAQFCIGCGASLAPATTGPTVKLRGVACPTCQTPNPDNARFCVVCGGEIRPTARPQPQAPPPAPPRRRPSPRSYPRVQYHPAPRMMPRGMARQAQRSGGNQLGMVVLLVGLLFLIGSKAFWPGILVVLALSMVVSHLTGGASRQNLQGALWIGGLALLFFTKAFWPGILVLLALSWLLGGWGR